VTRKTNSQQSLLKNDSSSMAVKTVDTSKNKGGRPKTRENMIKVSYKIHTSLHEQVKKISKRTGKSIQFLVTNEMKKGMTSGEKLINDYVDVVGTKKNTGIYLDIDFKNEFQEFCVREGVSQVFVFESIYSKIVRDNNF